MRCPSARLAGDAQRVAEALGVPAGQVKKATDVDGVKGLHARRPGLHLVVRAAPERAGAQPEEEEVSPWKAAIKGLKLEE